MSDETKTFLIGSAIIIFLLLWKVDFGAHRNEVSEPAGGSYLQEVCNDCDIP